MALKFLDRGRTKAEGLRRELDESIGKLQQAELALSEVESGIELLKLQDARSVEEKESLQIFVDRITSERIKDTQTHRDELAQTRTTTESLRSE
jgi:hypothetical protein